MTLSDCWCLVTTDNSLAAGAGAPIDSLLMVMIWSLLLLIAAGAHHPHTPTAKLFSQSVTATSSKMSVHQDCRMYEQKFPEVDDVVMVQVRCWCWCCSRGSPDSCSSCISSPSSQPTHPQAAAAAAREAEAAGPTGGSGSTACIPLLQVEFGCWGLLSPSHSSSCTLSCQHCPLTHQVKSIAEMGAYVSLLEYNGIEGMILLSELSRRRIRSITKLIKVCEGCGVWGVCGGGGRWVCGVGCVCCGGG